MKIILLMVISLLSNAVIAGEATAPFKITIVSVNDSGNMPFRVFGMSAFSSCPGNNFAYVAENDTVANAKISALLAASSAGKMVTLIVSPVDYFGNGTNYCKINVVNVTQ